MLGERTGRSLGREGAGSPAVPPAPSCEPSAPAVAAQRLPLVFRQRSYRRPQQARASRCCFPSFRVDKPVVTPSSLYGVSLSRLQAAPRQPSAPHRTSRRRQPGGEGRGASLRAGPVAARAGCGNISACPVPVLGLQGKAAPKASLRWEPVAPQRGSRSVFAGLVLPIDINL